MIDTLLTILEYIGYAIFAVIFFAGCVAWIFVFFYCYIFKPEKEEKNL